VPLDHTYPYRVEFLGEDAPRSNDIQLGRSSPQQPHQQVEFNIRFSVGFPLNDTASHNRGGWHGRHLPLITYIILLLVHFFMSFDEFPSWTFRRRTSHFLSLLIGILIYPNPINPILRRRLRTRHHITKAFRESTLLLVIFRVAIILEARTIAWTSLWESPFGGNRRV
jgi:hypothetical protein